MSENLVIFIAGQAVAIILAVIGVYVGLSKQLTTVATKITHLEQANRDQKTAHEGLRHQVQGISRQLERHATLIEVAQRQEANRQTERSAGG